jgi:hypothetical protein
MEAEPLKAEPPKRKRRWYQFSLRTLMILVTLFCAIAGGYVIHLRNIISEQRAELDRLSALESKDEKVWLDRGSGASIPPDFDREPFERASPWLLRTLLGDEAVGVIGFVERPTEDEVQRLARLFPEAFIIFYQGGGPIMLAGPQ